MVAVVAMVLAPGAWAYDFAASVPSGQTLYFSIMAGGVQVVYPNSSGIPTQGWSGYDMPTGMLAIPATVVHGGTTYAVLAVSNHAFYHCSGITGLTIAEGVKAVRANAFNGCTALTQATLPATLDTLGAAAFHSCSTLQTVVMMGNTPPSVTGSAFTGMEQSNMTLRVPCSATAAYSSTSPWSQFGTIDEEGCQLTLTATANHAERGTVSGSGTYAGGTQVTLTATANNGYFFACWTDGDTLNPRTVTLQSNATYTACFFAKVHDSIAVPGPTDTLYLHDTVTVVAVHTDTVSITQHDTITVVAVHTDTVVVAQHDTITVVAVHTDTVSITQHDTIYQTLYVPQTDTLWLHDTVVAHDTVVPTYFRLTVASTEGGIGIGSAIVAAGTVLEIGALPLEGHRFLRWDDGAEENPRQVQVTGNTTLTAQFETVGVLGIDPVEWQAYAVGRKLTVCCPVGEVITIYDMMGRRLLHHVATAPQTTAIMPSTGTYLVAVANGAARKVVVNDR